MWVVENFGVVEMQIDSEESYMRNITWNYVKELKDVLSIEKFENAHEFTYPADLKEILFKYNGGRPNLRYYDVGSEYDKEFKNLLSFNETDIENIYKVYPIESSDGTLVPFASDPAGNFFVLKDSKIFLWNHESNSCIFISDTFSDFLMKLHD